MLARGAKGAAALLRGELRPCSSRTDRLAGLCAKSAPAVTEPSPPCQRKIFDPLDDAFYAMDAELDEALVRYAASHQDELKLPSFQRTPDGGEHLVWPSDGG